MKVVLVMFRDGERRDFPISGEKTIVGRRQDCGLRIPTADVSRQHCEVSLVGNDLTVRDLGSSNGTYVNGKRIAEAKLLSGDKLSVGPVIFVVQVNGMPAKLTPFDAKIDAPAAEPAKAPAASTKPTAKKPLKDEDDEDTEEVLDLDDIDLSDMFDDDEDEDDSIGPPKKKK